MCIGCRFLLYERIVGNAELSHIIVAMRHAERRCVEHVLFGHELGGFFRYGVAVLNAVHTETDGLRNRVVVG